MPPAYPLPWIQPTPMHPLSADANLANKGAHPGQRQLPEDLLNPAATRMPWELHRQRQDSLQHHELSQQNQYPGPPPPYPMPSAYAPRFTAQHEPFQFHHLHGLSRSPGISPSPSFAPPQANLRQGTPAKFPFVGHSPIQQLEPRLTNDGLLQRTHLQPPVNTGFNVSHSPEPTYPEQPELDNIVVAQKNKIIDMQPGRELPPWPQTPGTILQLGRHCADVRELHRRANMQLQASPPAQPTAQQQMPPIVEALELSAVQGGASPEPTFVENLTTLAENIPPTTERPASTDGEDGEDGLQQTPPKEHANAAEIDLAILMELQGRERNPRRQATAKYREPTTPKPAKRKPNEVAIVKLPTPQNNKRPKRSSTGEVRPPPQKKQRTSSAPSVSDNDTANSAPSVSDNDTTRTNSGPFGNGTRIDVPITTIPIPHPTGPGRVELVFIESRPERDVDGDQKFVQDVLEVLEPQTKRKTPDMGRRQAIRISALLKQAEHPTEEEARFLTKQDAAAAVSQDNFFRGIIVTHNQQILPLQTIEEFLGEYYEDNADVWIQDPSVRPTKNAQIVHKVKMKAVKQRFTSNNKPHPQPWNCLELATHSDDGLRPMFLNQEECRLLTKLKIPDAADAARRRVYEPGFKEVEKWALLAQAGALTEPHQDSHGYSTYITVNVGLIGFGWLSLPTEQERADWRAQPADYTGGNWRYVVLKPGQTVYFPAGTVHFVFRLPAAGNTLAFGGHVLRCSNLVHWVNTLIEERDSKDVTNEDLTDSATGYLNRVERFVKQAVADGKTDKWGGDGNIEEFLRLKAEFESVRQK